MWIGGFNSLLELSTDRHIVAGVVQDTVLGPKAYTIYLENIPPLDPDYIRTEMVTYADHQGIYA